MAEWAWDWIARTIADSDEFDYLFVVSHYQTLDMNGEYNQPLMLKLVPLMKQYKVSAYIQGHRHTIEHVQQVGWDKPEDVHYFTIGSGSLYIPNWNPLPDCNEVNNLNIFCFHIPTVFY